MDQKLDEPIFIKCIDSPLGLIKITTNETHLLSVNFNEVNTHALSSARLPLVMINTLDQLDSYFKHTRTSFDLPIEPRGTLFQRTTWESLKKISFGEIISYQKLAEISGNISKTRAIASAIARNPVLIIIPCHRVIGSNGKLTGYSGGIEQKRSLLIHEGFKKDDKSLLF